MKNLPEDLPDNVSNIGIGKIVDSKSYINDNGTVKKGVVVTSTLTAGAAIGTCILPGVGTVIGAAIGGIAGSLAADYRNSKNLKESENYKDADY